jgi:hypothetical protein
MVQIGRFGQKYHTMSFLLPSPFSIGAILVETKKVADY